MLCKNPFMGGAVAFGCGRCLPCRVNKRRQWMWRQYLESLCHEECSFVTLTYSDKYLPEGENLDPHVVLRTIRAIRKAIFPQRIRYFLVGEYGDTSGRPHYHLSLYGMSRFSVHEVLSDTGETIGVTGEALIAKHWPWGFVSVAEFNELTAQYVAGYVVKKLTHAGDSRLGNRVPEFTRMSRRPGIGAGAMEIIAKSLIESGHGRALIEDTGDVPSELRVGRRRIPLSRYLLHKLRQAVGLTPEQVKEAKERKTYESSVELQALLSAALTDAPLSTARSVYLERMRGKLIQTEARSKLWKKRTTL